MSSIEPRASYRHSLSQKRISHWKRAAFVDPSTTLARIILANKASSSPYAMAGFQTARIEHERRRFQPSIA
eukprot:3243528-Rhodomonas_salina.2